MGVLTLSTDEVGVSLGLKSQFCIVHNSDLNSGTKLEIVSQVFGREL